MRTKSLLILGTLAMGLAACGSNGGILGRERPDEFAVQRQAPLVVPPDFNLAPPEPGTARPAEGTAAEQALDALQKMAAPNAKVVREGAVAVLPARALVVTALGNASYLWAAVHDAPENFYFEAAMGLALPMALGLSVAQPDREVVVETAVRITI